VHAIKSKEREKEREKRKREETQLSKAAGGTQHIVECR
jgi:hypothetical protein